MKPLGEIGNKQKRSEVYEKRKIRKLKEKRKRRAQPDRVKQPPRTLDSTREADETVVPKDDEEVLADEELDEFADYFAGKQPQILITTCKNASLFLLRFAKELATVFPNAKAYPRKGYEVKKICEYAANRGFTDVIVLDEHMEKPHTLWLIHLPGGPTANFRLSSVRLSKQIKGHGAMTEHRPELILNNFTTRLGHRVGRSLAALVTHDPQFHGRRVITFHNQRDFIFFRQHRYMFESADKARLQELGPRFTLKLRSLQRGTFDPRGEYEWLHRTDMDTSRRRFFL